MYLSLTYPVTIQALTGTCNSCNRLRVSSVRVLIQIINLQDLQNQTIINLASMTMIVIAALVHLSISQILLSKIKDMIMNIYLRRKSLIVIISILAR